MDAGDGTAAALRRTAVRPAGADALIQAGTESWNSSPTPLAGFWWEDWNYNNHTPITNITVNQGEEVFVDVKYNGNYTSTFHFENQTEYTNFTTQPQYTPQVDLSSADFITEGFPNPDYVRYGTMTFEWEDASGTWGNGYSITKDLTQANITEFDTYNNSSYSLEEQYPWDLGIGSYADGFYVSSTANATC